MSKLGQILSQYWSKIQGSLFPYLEEELDLLTQKQQQLITILRNCLALRFFYRQNCFHAAQIFCRSNRLRSNRHRYNKINKIPITKKKTYEFDFLTSRASSKA
jgi:hypothetical protein